MLASPTAEGQTLGGRVLDSLATGLQAATRTEAVAVRGALRGLAALRGPAALRCALREPAGLRAAFRGQPVEPDIAVLVVAARRGDEAAFTELYRRYADRVYRFCLFRVRRPADAEDLMQQTFLRAIEALPRYEERGLPFGAWLFRIARNVVIDHERSRRDALDLDELAHVGAEPATEDGTGALADRAALLGAIARLTPDQREVLGYRFFADLSARETGRLMGRGEATVRGLQARALAALRRELAALEGGVRR